MEEKMARTPNSHSVVTRADLTHALGDLDATKIASLLALEPTLGEVEEVAMRLTGAEASLADREHPAQGIVAAILNILAFEEEQDEDHPR
jgi:hypothetical protein